MKCNATVVDHKSTATGRIDDWRPEIANYNKGRQESPRGLRFGFEKLRIGEAVREDIPFFGLLGFVFGVLLAILRVYGANLATSRSCHGSSSTLRMLDGRGVEGSHLARARSYSRDSRK